MRFCFCNVHWNLETQKRRLCCTLWHQQLHNLLKGFNLKVCQLVYLAMFYFLALNSGPIISCNDISIYRFCVTGLFKSFLAHIQARYMAELTLCAVIKCWYYRKRGDLRLSCKDDTGCCLNYSWVVFDTSIWRYLNRSELNFFLERIILMKNNTEHSLYPWKNAHSKKWKAFGTKTLHLDLYNHSLFLLYLDWIFYQMPFISSSEAHNNEQ